MNLKYCFVLLEVLLLDIFTRTSQQFKKTSEKKGYLSDVTELRPSTPSDHLPDAVLAGVPALF